MMGQLSINGGGEGVSVSIAPILRPGCRLARQPSVSNLTDWTDGAPGSGDSLRKNLVSHDIMPSCSDDQSGPPNADGLKRWRSHPLEARGWPANY